MNKPFHNLVISFLNICRTCGFETVLQIVVKPVIEQQSNWLGFKSALSINVSLERDPSKLSLRSMYGFAAIKDPLALLHICITFSPSLLQLWTVWCLSGPSGPSVISPVGRVT